MCNSRYKTVEDCEKFVGKFVNALNKGECIKDFFNQKNEYTTKADILKYFFWGNLYGNEEYGGYRDSDSRKVVKVIHFLYYNKIWNNEMFYKKQKPELKITTKACNVYFDGRKLSGETQNTYNTSFWRGCEKSIDDYINNPDKFPDGIHKVIEKNRIQIEGEPLFSPEFLLGFYKEYHRIGNFMLLPEGSINAYRSNFTRQSGWYDYFDIFLEAIEAWYLSLVEDNNGGRKVDKDTFREKFKNFSDEKYYEYFFKIMEEEQNKDYFNSFNGFEDFVKFNCLEPFFEDEKIEKGLKQLRWKEEIFYHWINEDRRKDNKPEVTKEDYKTFAEKYVEVAGEIIQRRSELIIGKIFENTNSD